MRTKVVSRVTIGGLTALNLSHHTRDGILRFMEVFSKRPDLMKQKKGEYGFVQWFPENAWLFEGIVKLIRHWSRKEKRLFCSPKGWLNFSGSQIMCHVKLGDEVKRFIMNLSIEQ